MKQLLSLVALIIAAPFAHGAVFTNNASADSFVRASAPSSNYGGSGANSIAGVSATNSIGAVNGAFDTFIRFNTFSMVTNLNALYGTNNWVINGATVQVVEQGAPSNLLFNRGKGSFEIRWIANDFWSEGNGNPTTPSSSGIVYTNEPALLNPLSDVSLGTYTNAGVYGMLTFTLPLPATFTNDLQTGGEVGLFMTATDPNIGFTFVSRSFTPASSRPVLIVSAVPHPGIASVNISGSDLNFSCTNGASGSTYILATSSDLTVPITQWTRIATNALAATGTFHFTAPTPLDNSSPQQFFTVQTK